MFFIMQVAAVAPAVRQNRVMNVITFGDRFHPIRGIRRIRKAKQSVRDNWQLLERYEELDRARKTATGAMNNMCKTERLVNKVPEEYAHFAGLYKEVQTVNLGFATAFARACINEAKKIVAGLSEKTVKLALDYSAFTIAQKAMNVIAAAIGIVTVAVGAVTVAVVIVADAPVSNTLLIPGMGAGLSFASFAVGAAIKNLGNAFSKYYRAARIYKKAKEDAAKDKGPVDFTES